MFHAILLLVALAAPAEDTLAAAEAMTPLIAAELERLGRDTPSPEWLELARRAVEIREREQGPAHPDLALALVALGRLEERSSRPPEAVALYERALAIQTEAFGRDGVACAATLEYLGRSQREMGRLEDALASFERTLALRERHFGATSLEATHSLNALANLTAQMGRYETSRGYFERLVSTREALLGPQDLEVAYALGNYAVLYLRQDDYAAAVPLLRRSLAIVEAERGAEHPEVAHGLNNLGIVSMKTGDFSAAREYFERALAIREHAHGADHLDTAASRVQLAALLREIGDYEAARPLYERSLAYLSGVSANTSIRAESQNNYAMLLADMGDFAEASRLYAEALELKEKVYGPEHRNVAHTLNNLGALKLETGDASSARPLLERALAIKEKQLGAEHVSTAATLVPLGQVSAALGDRTAARDQLERALAIQEQKLGPGHPSVATTLNALGSLVADLGDPAEARKLLERALAVRETGLGPEHPLVAETLALVASVSLEAGDRARALEAGLAAERVGREHVQITVRTLAEREALGYASVRGSGLSTALSVAATPEAVERAWDSAIRSRSLVLDEMLLRQRALRRTDDPEIARAARELEAARERLARVAVRGPAGDDVAGYRRLLDWSRREKEEAERGVAERSAVFRSDASGARPGLGEVRKALGARTALVAYLRYAHGVEAVDSYLAFVLPSAGKAPVLVRLGEAKELEALIEAWRVEAGTRPPALARARVQSEARCRDAGLRLRERVWDPVAGALDDVDLVLVVADHALSFVPLAALPRAGEGYLAESELQLHQLATERDLLARSETSPAPAGGLLLVGSPDFGAGPPLRFAPLPASSAEIEEIAELWRRERAADRVDERSGKAADEASVRTLASGRRVLHLATHSYATPGDMPLALSGLALASANDGGGTSGEDGVLTAEEIVSLDLSGTEWVVLSACETGLGQLHEGEGILGLRRAFQIAGAHTLILSLWSVEDEATRAWMTELYRERLGGESTAEAVHAAGTRVLAARRGASLSTHPFYWGAFVAAGDWR